MVGILAHECSHFSSDVFSLFVESKSTGPLRHSRRFMAGALALLTCVAANAEPANEPASEPAAGQWASLEIVDVDERPWDINPPYAQIKTVFRQGTSNFKFIQFPPNWTTEMPARGVPGNEVGPHYHEFYEWGYQLEGDYVLYEPISPYQRNPIQYRWVEGMWMDRPPYSLHSGDWATGGIRAQNPGTLILFEEGTRTISLDPSNENHPVLDGPLHPDAPDYRDMKFVHPLLIASGSTLEWEADTQIEGRLVKWLSDDPVGGFRAQLVKVPPGWSHPDGAHKSYFEQAHRLRYFLYGDLQIELIGEDGTASESYRLETSDFIHQPPRSLWAFDEGPVTEDGAVWLEVTYSKGLTRGGGPIERPKLAE